CLGLFDFSGGLFAGACSYCLYHYHARSGRCAGGGAFGKARVQGRRLCQPASGGKAGQAVGAGGIVDALGRRGSASDGTDEDAGRDLRNVTQEAGNDGGGRGRCFTGRAFAGSDQRRRSAALARAAWQRCARPDGGDCMTRSPKTIGAQEFAATALARMEEMKITSLVVVDFVGDDRRLRGIVHLHDLWGTEMV